MFTAQSNVPFLKTPEGRRRQIFCGKVVRKIEKVSELNWEGRGKQILNSKISIPEMPGTLVERTNILEDVEKADSRITVFNAGAGFGKTILMAELARRHSGRCLWYQVDQADNDPVYFLRGLLYGILKSFQGHSDHLTREGIQRLSRNMENMEQMILEMSEFLAGTVDGHLFFMLDDFHEINDESVVRIMRSLIDCMPENVRFCFTVKGSFPGFLASYIVKEAVFLVETERFRFSEEEARNVITRQIGHIPEEDVVKSIMEYAEGWPAGVMFACLSLKTDHSLKDGALMLNGTKIYDYIYYEIFRKLPYDIQQFLLNTSILDSVSIPLCGYVTGRQDSSGVLDYLAAENMFVYKLKGEKKWYRYHSIFRDFLQSRLPENQKNDVLSKAAQYFLKKGEVDQAVTYAMRCGAYEVVSVAVERDAEQMLQQGRRGTLKVWIDYLEPYKEYLDAPCLYIIYRFMRSDGESEKALRYLEQAVYQSQKQEEFERFGKYGLEMAEYMRETQGIPAVLPMVRWLDERLEAVHVSSGPEVHIKRLEYHLQMNDREWLKQAAEKLAGQKKKIRTAMERNMILWALELYDKTEGWGNTLEEARMYRRVSPVFAEYGFFCYACSLYKKGNADFIRVLQEGLTIQGGSAFTLGMELLRLVHDYKKSVRKAERTELGEHIRCVLRKLQRQGGEEPELQDEDERLLAEILLGSGDHAGEEESVRKEDALLQVHCLGRFLVEAGGENLQWRTKKTRELFACLFDADGRGMDKNALTFRLWPEAAGKNGSVLFNTTVSYLRKALAQAGAADVLIVKDRLYSLDMQQIWSDLDRLEEFSELVKKNRFDELGNPQEMAGIYDGEYMGSEDFRWLVGRKEYIEQMFLQTARQLAVHEMKKKHWDSAILIFQKMLDVSVCSTSVLRMLLSCRMEQGDVGGAYRQYEKLRQVWEEEWEQVLPRDLAEFLQEGDR